MKKIDISKELLFELYYENNRSIVSIAKELGVGKNTIRRRFEEFGFDTRGKAGWRKKESDRKIENLKCPTCGNSFTIKTCLTEKTELNFCSSSCSAKYYSSIRNYKNPKEKVKCEVCSKEFLKSKYYIDRTNHNLCSRECMGKFRTEYLTGENCPKYKRIITKCSNCSKEMKVIESRYNNYENLFCDTNCMAEYYSKALLKDNNPNWKGGYHNKLYGPDWKDISKQIRERDNYTCQLCNKGIEELPQNHKLDVHHIIPIRTFNGDYIEANKEENLITLCSVCHMVVENKNYN